jgi:pimeloyl-ACP methyl ester carboxylesterase
MSVGDSNIGPAQHHYFFVGGRYADLGAAKGKAFIDQAYVHQIAPSEACTYPIVMIHGGGLTGLCWEATPDGRPGWADFFVARQFPVFVMDQPARGRSAWCEAAQGALYGPDIVRIERRFTAAAEFNLWETARFHNQWPGSGRIGDPVFDQFSASLVPSVPDRAWAERATSAAAVALLDKIGPAILFTHSQSGTYGWVIADARPDLVKAIVAVEPNGPPFVRHDEIGPPNHRREIGEDKPWGITVTELTYDPPVVHGTGLPYVREDAAGPSRFAPCYAQESPARRLPNLVGVPVAVVTSQAGYHSAFDHCTVRFLREAGVNADHILLEEEGVYGNGHMMMIERNSDEVAVVIHRWLLDHGLAGTGASESHAESASNDGAGSLGVSSKAK